MTVTPEQLKDRLIDIHKEFNTPNKYNTIGLLNLAGALGEMVLANKDIFTEALDRLVSNLDLKMIWGTDYATRDPETEIELRVWNPNGHSWFWAANDPVEEDGCVSTLPGFDTKEEAMLAAEQWYGKWLLSFKLTGKREIE